MKRRFSKSTRINVILMIASSLLTLAGIEFGFRLYVSWFWTEQYENIQRFMKTAGKDDTLQRFEAHPYLSYARSDTQYGEGGLYIRNRLYPYKKPDHVFRIACLGGSTTLQKYPVQLRLYLHSETTPPRFEVMDFGCDGWTLQESLINYVIRVQDFQPDIILLHHGANDGPPRVWGEYRPDYSHFRTHYHDQTGALFRYLSQYSFTVNFILQRQGFLIHDLQNFVIRNIPKDEKRGVIPPESMRAYRRNLEILIRLAEHNQAYLILADMPFHPSKSQPNLQTMISEHNQMMQKFATEHQTGYIPFASFFEDKQHLFADAVHMTEEGRYWKAQEAAKAVWQWYYNHPELEGVSRSIQPKASSPQTAYRASREIQLSWRQAVPQAEDYHIYVKERYESEYTYLGRTGSGEAQSFLWKKDAPLLHRSHRSGPAVLRHYEFLLFALTPNGNQKLDPKQSPGILRVENRISYPKPVSEP